MLEVFLLSSGSDAQEASSSDAAAETAEKALRENRTLYFNNILDAVVTVAFLALVSAVFLLSVREWLLLVGRRKLATLRESEPVWLPDYAVAESKPVPVAGLLALGFALAKELSGEAQIERAQRAAQVCSHNHDAAQPPENGCARRNRSEAYIAATEERFNGIRRCC